jgi:phosphoribosyl 1,2-cyclic phosphodiesterase
MIEQLKNCSALFVEFNHDQDMLSRSKYPQTLKHRISGGFGHINNVEAIELLERVNGPNLQYVVAAHLSRENNDPDLVRGLIAQSLGWDEEYVDIATQELGVGWRTLGSPI